MGTPEKTLKTASSITMSVTIAASYDAAFDYVSNGRLLPEWANGFILKVREDGGRLFATTPMGEMPLRVISDRESGIVDNVIGETRFRGRLIPNGEGLDYVFTLQQPPQMPKEAWEKEGVAGLRKELDNLKRVLESR